MGYNTVKVEFEQKSERGEPVRYLEKSLWIRGYKCKIFSENMADIFLESKYFFMAETVSEGKIKGKWGHRSDVVKIMGQLKGLYWYMAERLEGHENGSITIWLAWFVLNGENEL